MKRLRNVLYPLSVCLLMGTTLTGCLDEDDPDNSEKILYAYMTVGDQDADNVYTLYADGGGIIYPTPASVYALTESYSGLSDIERCYFGMTYQKENYSTDGNGNMIVRNATLKYGITIPVDTIMSAEMADSLKVTSSDSLYQASDWEGFWGYRGYLTATMNLGYSYNSSGTIEPTVTMVCDSIRTDSLFVTLCYNRHASVSYGTSTFIRSYSLNRFEGKIPGTDSILVIARMKGLSGKKFKIGREDLTTGR